MEKNCFVLLCGVKPNIPAGLMDAFMLYVGLTSKAYWLHQNKPVAVFTVKYVESIIAYAIHHDNPQLRSGF